MGKVVTAEYDAAAQKTPRFVSTTAEPAWTALRGSLSKEAGDDLARAVDELFPPWK